MYMYMYMYMYVYTDICICICTCTCTCLCMCTCLCICMCICMYMYMYMYMYVKQICICICMRLCLASPSALWVGHLEGYPTEARKMSVLYLNCIRNYTTFVGPPKSGFQPASWWLSRWPLEGILGSTPREPRKCLFFN